MKKNNPLVLRMDDVGASSKKFNVYSKSRIGNFLFLKKIKPFKAWGPYEEISTEQWKKDYLAGKGQYVGGGFMTPQ